MIQYLFVGVSMRCAFIALIAIFIVQNARAEAPVVGRGAAAKYFEKRAPNNEDSSRWSTPGARLLSLHVGSYSQSTAYVWNGKGKQTGVGRSSYGVTYRVAEWQNSMDMHIRIDFNEYRLGDKTATKMSFMPLVLFPDSSANFPLYFGAGIGAGVYFKQVEDESNLALDYQLVTGARFTNLFEGTGFFIEGGLKNHLHLLSDGQFNGTFLAGGLVFTF
jgi:hypothetical protein